MGKKIFTLLFILILINISLCGCNEMTSSTADINEKLIFDSDIVELIDSDLIFHQTNNKIKKVEVKYLFRNLKNKKIDIEVFAEFIDIDGNILSQEGPKEISLSPNYTEKSYSGANIIYYNDVQANLVENVRLIVREKEYN